MTRIASFPQRAGFQPILPRPLPLLRLMGTPCKNIIALDWSALFARGPKPLEVGYRAGMADSSQMFFGSKSPACSPSYTLARFQTSYYNITYTHMLLWPKNRHCIVSAFACHGGLNKHVTGKSSPNHTQLFISTEDHQEQIYRETLLWFSRIQNACWGESMNTLLSREQI